MKYLNLSTVSGVKIISTLLFLSIANCLYGQLPSYAYYYRVYFRDKGTNYAGNYSSQELLSSRALNRRLKAGIPVPEFKDIRHGRRTGSQCAYRREGRPVQGPGEIAVSRRKEENA